MNIVFLIGNGFDLNLGLKTSYSDFYPYYTKIRSKSSVVNKLKENISSELKNWSDLELSLGNYTANINSITEFDEVFEDIGNNLAEYLDQEEKKFDFGRIDREKFIESLKSPEEYLSKADENNIKIFRKQWSNSQWNIRIITFNYTRTIEKIIGKIPGSQPIGTHNGANIILHGIDHIHGYTDERMVMGVNDITQLKNKDFHKNQDVIEAIVKNNCNQAIKHTIDDFCRQQILSANLICIFGSSIGVTDNMWWELIGQRLAKDCILILFYQGEEIPLRINYKKGREERKIRTDFQNKSKMSEELKKSTANKIYIGINLKIFNILKSSILKKD
jgi:hypothetical protein